MHRRSNAVESPIDAVRLHRTRNDGAHFEYAQNKSLKRVQWGRHSRTVRSPTMQNRSSVGAHKDAVQKLRSSVAYYDLISKFHVGLKSLLQQGLVW